jgi:hypothetical protein
MIKTFIQAPFKHLLLPARALPAPGSGTAAFHIKICTDYLKDRSAKINPLK